MTSSKLRDSTSRAALDCHPTLGWFGSTNSSWSGSASALPVARSDHTGADESSLLQTGLTGDDGLDAGCIVTVASQNGWAVVRLSLSDFSSFSFSLEKNAVWFGTEGASHDNPKTPNVHISGSRRFKHHKKIHERTSKRERKKNMEGEGKKERNFGPPTLRGPTLSPPFGTPPLRGPTLPGPIFSGFGPTFGALMTHTRSRNGLDKIGLAKIQNVQNWIGPNWIKSGWPKTGLAKVGLFRMTPSRKNAYN